MLTSDCYCCCTAAVVLSSREDWRWTSGARTWCHSLAMVVAGTFLLPLARISWASMAGSANWKSYFLNVRLNSFVRVSGHGVVCVLGGGVEKRAGLVPGSILLREANRRKKGLDYIFSSQSEEGASWRKFVIERGCSSTSSLLAVSLAGGGVSFHFAFADHKRSRSPITAELRSDAVVTTTTTLAVTTRFDRWIDKAKGSDLLWYHVTPLTLYSNRYNRVSDLLCYPLVPLTLYNNHYSIDSSHVIRE